MVVFDYPVSLVHKGHCLITLLVSCLIRCGLRWAEQNVSREKNVMVFSYMYVCICLCMYLCMYVDR